MDFNKLLQRAQKMQEDLEKSEAELKQKEYTNKVVNSIVQIKMNSDYQIEEIKFDDNFVKNFTSDDFEALRDAITLAVNDISREITENKESMMSGLAGSINIPGLR